MQDLPVDNLISVDQAIAILDAVPLQPRIVQLPLLDAIDLHLAENIFADRDFPPFDKAVMDGYAFGSADMETGGARLKIIETIAAGQVGERVVQPGEAVKIMTGAPMPAGADTVVPVERTRVDGSVGWSVGRSVDRSVGRWVGRWAAGDF